MRNFSFEGQHYKVSAVITPKDVIVKFKKDDGDVYTYLWHGEISEESAFIGIKSAFERFDKTPDKELTQCDIKFYGGYWTKTELVNDEVYIGVVDTPKEMIDSVKIG